MLVCLCVVCMVSWMDAVMRTRMHWLWRKGMLRLDCLYQTYNVIVVDVAANHQEHYQKHQAEVTLKRREIINIRN